MSTPWGRRARTLLCALTLPLANAPVAAADPGPKGGPDERKSGYAFMGRETRAMQDDEIANPATLAVLDGELLWNRKAGARQNACADCHGKAEVSMRGVAARFPAFDAAHGRVLNLEQKINACRTDRQQAAPLAYESRDLLALGAYLGRQSRGLPIAVKAEGPMQAVIEAGRARYVQRQGQLNLSCAQCHEGLADRKLVGNPITQGHATGYPIYRLEWQSVGSLQRRLRNCMTGVRAEPFPYGSAQAVELEAYLMHRARGMPMETPAVRP